MGQPKSLLEQYPNGLMIVAALHIPSELGGDNSVYLPTERAVGEHGLSLDVVEHELRPLLAQLTVGRVVPQFAGPLTPLPYKYSRQSTTEVLALLKDSFGLEQVLPLSSRGVIRDWLCFSIKSTDYVPRYNNSKHINMTSTIRSLLSSFFHFARCPANKTKAPGGG